MTESPRTPAILESTFLMCWWYKYTASSRMLRYLLPNTGPKQCVPQGTQIPWVASFEILFCFRCSREWQGWHRSRLAWRWGRWWRRVSRKGSCRWLSKHTVNPDWYTRLSRTCLRMGATLTPSARSCLWRVRPSVLIWWIWIIIILIIKN